MSKRDSHPNPQPGPLTPTMRSVLTTAASRWDSAVISGDWRTWAALYRRGYIEYLRGTSTNRYGGTSYNAITGIYITEAGRNAL